MIKLKGDWGWLKLSPAIDSYWRSNPYNQFPRIGNQYNSPNPYYDCFPAYLPGSIWVQNESEAQIFTAEESAGLRYSLARFHLIES